MASQTTPHNASISGVMTQGKLKAGMPIEISQDPLKEQTGELPHEDDGHDQLPRKAGRLTLPIVLVLIVGGLERAAYYAISAPWRRSISGTAQVQIVTEA